MGREIRKVPPNWEHPRYTADTTTSVHQIGEYIPMLDADYEEAAQDWIRHFDQWRNGEHKSQSEVWCSDIKYYWEYDSPPEPEYHRPAFTKEPTWYQGYETVSEGTPFTPPFGTQAELVDWLVANGDPVHGRITRQQAESFVEDAYAPSMVIQGGVLKGGIQAMSDLKEKDHD